MRLDARRAQEQAESPQAGPLPGTDALVKNATRAPGPGEGGFPFPGTGAIVADAICAPGMGSIAAPKFRGAKLPGLAPIEARASGFGLAY